MNPFELISIAAEPIREIWVRRYRTIEKKLESMRREWRLFEQEAYPKFQAWYYSTFSQDLAKVNEWSERAREYENIFSAIVAHQTIYNLPQVEAYIRVKRALREKRDPYPNPDDVAAYQKRIREKEEADRLRREERARRLEEVQKKFWDDEEEAQAYEEALHDRLQRDAFSEEEKASAPEEKKEDDLKTLYRKIVRALHPDSGHEMSPIEKEWWNQAQTAYKRKDREALRMISLKIEGSGKISIESVEQIGAIIEMCANLFAQQDEILYQKKRLRKNNVYRFWTSRSRPANRAKFKVELQAQLAYQARNLKSFVEESKQIFKDLDRAFSRTQMDDEGDDYRPKKEKGRGRGRGRRD